MLVLHNWPVLVALGLTLGAALSTWRQPTRQHVALLYCGLLLILAYEYHKHIGPTLQDAANYLLMFDLLWLNRPIWLLVGPIATGFILTVAGAFCAYACWPRVWAAAREPAPARSDA